MNLQAEKVPYVVMQIHTNKLEITSSVNVRLEGTYLWQETMNCYTN